jgi:hypothetical protein
VGAEPLTLSFRCEAPAVTAEGQLQRELLPSIPAILRPRQAHEVQLLHAKRDGQVCFLYCDDLTGSAIEKPETAGQPGDLFFFGGDPSLEGGEARGQILLVYGEDNLFVEPFDRGFQTRGYQRIGRLEPTNALQLLGEEIWRHGARQVALECTG